MAGDDGVSLATGRVCVWGGGYHGEDGDDEESESKHEYTMIYQTNHIT
jgi:hypothetical protein